MSATLHVLHSKDQTIGGFLRVGHTGHRKLEALIAASRLRFRRFVFDADSVFGIYEKQLTESPAPPSQHSQQPITPEMDRLILRCLDRDPAQRPASALELRACLLQSPRAADSTPESREAWWKGFQSQVAPRSDVTSEISANTVRIDMSSRIEASRQSTQEPG